MSTNIIKSQSDTRQYKHITLANKMQILMVSDPEADKSAASLDVKVGCSLDPKPLYGTAHFLEHMLFMGTEKYPSENEYTEFIKNNGGSGNAFTSLTDTNYYFDISNEAFAEALERFSHFFKKPLLGESSTEREMKAVDSEFNQSLQSDAWRYFAVLQENCNPEGLLNRFVCGNLESLKQDGIRDALLDFHKKWYSANIMKLCVVSNKCIDELETLVNELFNEVPNHDIVVPNLGEPAPLLPSDLGQLYKFVPVKDKDILNLYWVLPYSQLEHRSQPLKYFSNLFGHEGENSILSYLISEGLALELSSGYDHELWNFSCFYVDITLTRKGLENVERVIESVFTYAHNIKARGVQDYIFDEIKRVGEINFTFADKSGPQRYALGLAWKMQTFEGDDLPYILQHSYIADIFDKPRIEQMLDLMLDYKNLNIFIRSKSLESICDREDRWYKTKYSRQSFSEEMIRIISSPNVPINKKLLDYPPPNNLLPKDLDVLEANQAHSARPILVQQWNETDLWYKKDDKFKRPKAIVEMKLYTNDCMFGRTAHARVLIEVWNNMLKETLREFNYTASMAELETTTSVYHDNVNFVWNGYNDSLPVFVVETLQRVKSFRVEDYKETFDQVKEKLLQEWHNFYLEQTYIQAYSNFENIIVSGAYEKRTLRNILENFTHEDLISVSKDWLKSGRTLWFVDGNISKDSAISLVEKAREILQIRPVDKEDLVDIRCIALPAQQTQLLEVPLQDKTNENSCLVSYFEVGLETNDIRKKLTHQVVMQYLDEPTFNQLRTIEQLGYVVFARSSSFRDVIGSRFIVQSPGQSCEYIVNSLNTLLNVQRQKVKELSDEDFKTQVDSVMTKIAEKDYNLNSEHSRLWGEISTHKYVFDRQEKEIEILKTLTKQEFQDHFEKTFFIDRKRLDYELTSEKHKEGQEEWKAKNLAVYYPNAEERVQVEVSLQTFKKKMSLHPDLFKASYASFKM